MTLRQFTCCCIETLCLTVISVHAIALIWSVILSKFALIAYLGKICYIDFHLHVDFTFFERIQKFNTIRNAPQRTW